MDFFCVNRECLDLLFRAASDALLTWCAEQGFTPGIVSVMHTFGARLDFHPHIHILVTSGGLNNSSDSGSGSGFLTWNECKYFAHDVLKKKFKYFLIKYLRKWVKKNNGHYILPDYVKQIWITKLGCDNLFNVTQKLYNITWYVHIGEKLDNAKFTVNYIGRYAKRPSISEANIIDYNREQKTISFLYKDKLNNNAEKIETISVHEFIGRLVKHIPNKHFRMIRHYGLYANRVKKSLWELLTYQISKLFSYAKILFEPKKLFNNWRDRIIDSIGIDPLICENCNEQMELTEIGYRARDGTFKTYLIL